MVVPMLEYFSRQPRQ